MPTNKCLILQSLAANQPIVTGAHKKHEIFKDSSVFAGTENVDEGM